MKEKLPKVMLKLAKDADLVEIRRNIGMVFQRPNPFPKSIYDNVGYGVKLHHQPTRDEMDKIVEKSLRRAGFGTRYPTDFMI